jgi:hypothetical protein
MPIPMYSPQTLRARFGLSSFFFYATPDRAASCMITRLLCI